MLRRTLVTLLVAALALSAIGLAQTTVEGYPGLGMVPGTPGGTLTLALDDSPPRFFNYGEISAVSNRLTMQLFDPLIYLDLETYDLIPGLARDWSVSDDGLVYTLFLREGVAWHDGVPFTADDVVFTFEQIIKNPEARAGDAATFLFTVDGEARPVTFEAVDELTVRITLPAPSAPFLQVVGAFYPHPKHKLLPFSVEGGAQSADINNAWPTDIDPSEVVGTGAFMLSEYVPGQVVRLVRNPNYWRFDEAGTRLPYFDGVNYLIVPGSDAQVAQFLAGNLDQLNISGGQFPDFKSRELAGAPFRVVASRALFGRSPALVFNFNAADPDLARVFSDVAFRQAMEYAVDRMRVVEDVYSGLAEIPGTPVAPVNGAFYEDTKPLMRMYDLEAAAAALDALGLVDTNGNGVRNLTPTRELEFTLLYGVDLATQVDIATILQNDFAEIGVKANLQGIPFGQVLGTGLSGDYEALVFGLGNLRDPEQRKPIWQPGGSLYYWHRATQPAVQGGAPNFDVMADWELRVYEIFDQGTTMVDPVARAELYREWQRLNAMYVPVIMIVKEGNVGAVYDNVHNYVYSVGVNVGYNPVPFMFKR